MDKKEMSKCVKWFSNAYEQIAKAGGNPNMVLGSIPEDLLYTFVANDIQLVFSGNKRS